MKSIKFNFFIEIPTKVNKIMLFWNFVGKTGNIVLNCDKT
jgi:hypothetical protein